MTADREPGADSSSVDLEARSAARLCGAISAESAGKDGAGQARRGPAQRSSAMNVNASPGRMYGSENQWDYICCTSVTACQDWLPWIFSLLFQFCTWAEHSSGETRPN